jgi:hypothetical protein
LDGDAGSLRVGGASVSIQPRGIVSARLVGDVLTEIDGLER